MADTSFPPSLTRTPRVASLSETAPDVVVRTEMDAGPSKVRRRFTGDKRDFTVELDLRRSEVATFDTFFLTTTKGGSLSFAWKHPRTGSTADFRFLEPPVYKPQTSRSDGSEWWIVSFKMELLPGTDSSIPVPGDGPYPPGGGGAYGFGGVYYSAPEEPEGDEGGEAIFFGTVFEADAAPAVFVYDLLAGGYSYIEPEDETGSEDVLSVDADGESTKGGGPSSSDSSASISSVTFPGGGIGTF